MTKNIDDSIKKDLHGAVDKWMEEYKDWVSKDREEAIKSALHQLIAERKFTSRENEEKNLTSFYFTLK